MQNGGMPTRRKGKGLLHGLLPARPVPPEKKTARPKETDFQTNQTAGGATMTAGCMGSVGDLDIDHKNSNMGCPYCRALNMASAVATADNMARRTHGRLRGYEQGL